MHPSQRPTKLTAQSFCRLIFAGITLYSELQKQINPCPYSAEALQEAAARKLQELAPTMQPEQPQELILVDILEEERQHLQQPQEETPKELILPPLLMPPLLIPEHTSASEDRLEVQPNIFLVLVYLQVIAYNAASVAYNLWG